MVQIFLHASYLYSNSYSFYRAHNCLEFMDCFVLYCCMGFIYPNYLVSSLNLGLFQPFNQKFYLKKHSLYSLFIGFPFNDNLFLLINPRYCSLLFFLHLRYEVIGPRKSFSHPNLPKNLPQ